MAMAAQQSVHTHTKQQNIVRMKNYTKKETEKGNGEKKKDYRH